MPRAHAGRTGAGRAIALQAGILLAVFGAAGGAAAQTALFPDGARGPYAPTFQTPADKNLLPSTNVDQTQPLYLQGDELIYDNSGNTVIARGNVEIYYNDYALTADEVVYDQSASTLTALGNVTLREPNGNVIRADRYTLTDDFRDGFVESLSVVTKDETRIAARRATRIEGNTTEFSDAKFTPCRSKDGMPPLWCISSRRIIHDKDAATITYQDAQFEVFGQPVVYLPYFQHADPSVKRRSGFLPPSLGSSTELGFMTSVPYYFALAPNYDFTFSPMYSSKQGVLYYGEWRHRLANGSYKVEMAGIDQRRSGLPDSLSSSLADDLEGWRGSIETEGKFSLSSWWSFGWDVTLESDDTFRRFYKLDSVLLTDRVNRVFAEGISDRNYFGAQLYHFGGLLLSDTPRSESRVHPVIDYNYVFADPILGGELRWDTNAYSLSRDEFVYGSAGRVSGYSQNTARVTTELTWRKTLIDRIGITYTPFANLRGDVTQYDNYRDPYTPDAFAELQNPSLEDDVAAHGVAAGGVTISYPWVASDGRGTNHTIEPIGQIIGRTATNAKRVRPNEDAQSLVFDDTNLFDIDKFSGYDRNETGTRANVGVQYTFQLNSGGYGRLLAGQSFHLAGENPYADPGKVTSFRLGTAPAIREDNIHFFQRYAHSPVSGLETTRSDYVVGAYLSPAPGLQFVSQSRFDENTFELRREDAAVSAVLGPVTLSTMYTYASADPEFGFETDQQDIYGSVGLQITNNWSLQGVLRYDLDEEFLLSDQIGLRYADECFIFSATYAESHYQNADIDTDRTVYLAFEFKHLGQFGYKTDIFSADENNN